MRIRIYDKNLSKNEQLKLEKYQAEYEPIYSEAEKEVERIIADRFSPIAGHSYNSSAKSYNEIIHKLKESIITSDNSGNDSNQLTLSRVFAIKEEKIFVSLVQGDSMTEAGINAGDLVIP